MTQQPQITTAWQLISVLIEECTGMTGDAIVDQIRVERGAQWVKRFQKEYPLQAAFIGAMLQGTPETAINALRMFNPEAASLPFAERFLAGMQGALRNGK
jgi:hypothetical protein